MRMGSVGLVVAAVALVQGGIAAAGVDGPAKGAPPELAHFSKLIGDWTTTEESFRRDGSGWDPSKSAEWSFYWAFDGWGIGDDYTSPPSSESVDDESKRQRGTNLRIYNPETEQWVMTWLTVTSKAPAAFTATSSDDEIVMSSEVLNPQGFFIRITFFDIRKDSFEWKQEWSKDKETWTEVYRIHGTRANR